MRRLVVLALVMGSPSLATADVDVELRSGVVVSGTLEPATEAETFRLQLPAGARLTVTAVGAPLARKQPKPSLVLRLLDAGDGVVAGTTPGGSKPRAKLKGVVVPATGAYRVVVTGDGATAGNYTLKVRWKQIPKVAIPRQTLEQALQVPFAADEGSTASIVVKAAKGSAALPRLTRVTNTGSSAGWVPDPPADAGDRAHKAKRAPLPGGGDFVLEVTNAGQVGDVGGKIKLVAPRRTKTRVDVTGDAIGAETIEDVARGKVFDAAGGRIVIGPGDSQLIAGAALDVPLGALRAPTVLLVGTAPAISPGSAALEAAGPSVSFGPAGQTFDGDVIVTLPFSGPAADLSVIERDGDGTQSTVAANLTIDAQNGTVSFPTRHFTAFRVFRSRPVPGDLDGDSIADLVVRAPAANGSTGTVFVFFGPLGADRSTANASTRITGSGPGGEFGSFARAVDLDGDGRSELLVGAPAEGTPSGRFYVFRNVGRGQTLTTGDAAVVLSPAPGGAGNFGSSAAVGDVSGDGTPDLVVGEKDSDVTQAGAAHVFFGNGVAPFPFSSGTTASADVTVRGAAPDDGLGVSVLVADLAGDSTLDLVVAADQDNSGGTGFVAVFPGPLVPASLLPTDALLVLTGERSGASLAGDRFGGEGLAAGDLNGDGVPDLAVSAPGHDPANAGRANVGAAYVFFGGPGFSSHTGAVTADRKLPGSAAEDSHGLFVSAGDVNADGIDDLLLGATGLNASAKNGAVFVYFGRTGAQAIDPATPVILRGRAAGALFAVPETPLDLNDDGRTDLVGSAPGDAGGGLDAGAVYVLFGTASFPTGGTIAQATNGSRGLRVTGAPGEFLGATLQ